MGITLKPEIEKRIADQMKAGGFASADDVVEAGLALLEQLTPASEDDPKRVKADIAEGLEQARRGELIDGEQALAERRRRRAQRQQQTP